MCYVRNEFIPPKVTIVPIAIYCHCLNMNGCNEDDAILFLIYLHKLISE